MFSSVHFLPRLRMDGKKLPTVGISWLKGAETATSKLLARKHGDIHSYLEHFLRYLKRTIEMTQSVSLIRERRRLRLITTSTGLTVLLTRKTRMSLTTYASLFAPILRQSMERKPILNVFRRLARFSWLRPRSFTLMVRVCISGRRRCRLRTSTFPRSWQPPTPHRPTRSTCWDTTSPSP